MTKLHVSSITYSPIILVFYYFQAGIVGARVGEGCLQEITDELTPSECQLLIKYLEQKTYKNLTSNSTVVDGNNTTTAFDCFKSLIQLDNDAQNETKELITQGLKAICKPNLSPCLKKEFPDFSDEEELSSVLEQEAEISFEEHSTNTIEIIVLAVLLFLALWAIGLQAYHAYKDFKDRTNCSLNKETSPCINDFELGKKFSGSDSDD